MINRFCDYLRYELNRAPLTITAYKKDILQFGDWLGNGEIENIDFQSVTQQDIRAWLGSLSKSGDSARTIRRKTQSLRALFRWMIREDIIKKSPLRDIPLPKISKPLPDIVKANEIESAISGENHSESQAWKDLRNSLILEMFYSLGIRKAELISLNDSSISFTKGEIKVIGKRSKERVIPLPQALLQNIKEWQKIRDDLAETFLPDSPLFSFKGKRISEKNVYNIVTSSLETSTAKKRSPHALRHSFASGMLNGGANLDSVREFLGHASLSTTQIYTHITLKEIKDAYRNAHPRSFNQDDKD